MSAIFDFSSLITVFLFFICTCTYIRELRPTIFDGQPKQPQNSSSDPTASMHQKAGPSHDGLLGFCWKMSRIGERLSPFVSGACLAVAIHTLFIRWGWNKDDYMVGSDLVVKGVQEGITGSGWKWAVILGRKCFAIHLLRIHMWYESVLYHYLDLNLVTYPVLY